MQEFLGGRSGAYALDCHRPISEDNPHQLFAEYPYAGPFSGMVVGMRRSVTDGGYIAGYVSHVELHDDNELLGYFVVTPDTIYSFVWKREGEEAIRLYQFEDTTKHVQYVTKGIFAQTAIATPVYPHCRLSLFPLVQAW